LKETKDIALFNSELYMQVLCLALILNQTMNVNYVQNTNFISHISA